MKYIKYSLLFIFILACDEVFSCSGLLRTKDHISHSCDSSSESCSLQDQSSNKLAGYFNSRMRMIQRAKDRGIASENYKKCVDSNPENLSLDELVKQCKRQMAEDVKLRPKN